MSTARLKRGAAHPTDPNLHLWRYHKAYPGGLWMTLEKFEKAASEQAASQRAACANFIKPTDSLKRGALHPTSGALFWQYSATCVGGELWHSPEDFAQKIEKLKLYQDSRREQIRATSRKFRKVHKERLKEVNRRRNKALRPYYNEYERKRTATDPVFALAKRVRTRIREALRDRRLKKSQKSADIVGCGWGELRAHLESKFTKGMTWDNMNLWHVDHIIPLATAKTEAQVLALCHYSNLQPLWAVENLSKSAKLNYQHTHGYEQQLGQDPARS